MPPHTYRLQMLFAHRWQWGMPRLSSFANFWRLAKRKMWSSTGYTPKMYVEGGGVYPPGHCTIALTCPDECGNFGLAPCSYGIGNPLLSCPKGENEYSLPWELCLPHFHGTSVCRCRTFPLADTFLWQTIHIKFIGIISLCLQGNIGQPRC